MTVSQSVLRAVDSTSRLTNCKRVTCLGQVDMTTDAPSRSALVVSVRVPCIPLTMQVIGHVDDVINGGGNAINWKCFEIPVRRWCGDRNRMVRSQLLFENREELEVAFRDRKVSDCLFVLVSGAF